MNFNYLPRSWMKHVLIAASFCNFSLGAIAIFFPTTMLGWMRIEAGNVATLFLQFLGIIVAVYGVGYAIAAQSPYRHWLIVFVGLLGNFFGLIGIAVAVLDGSLPSSTLWTALLNVMVWWFPFVAILWGTAKHAHAVHSAHEDPEADDPLRDLRTNTGKRLDEVADVTPQLVVFLRHAGCTFCRQALADIAASRKQIEATGCEIVFVHLGEESDDSTEVFRRYKLDDLPRISDPTCRLYRQFGLDLGGFSDLFGLRVWIRGLWFGLVHGHGIGAILGNSFQMPGVYLYHCGTILGGFRHETASDRPNYAALAQQIEIQQRSITD